MVPWRQQSIAGKFEAPTEIYSMRIGFVSLACLLIVGCNKGEEVASAGSDKSKEAAVESAASSESFPDIRDWNSVLVQLRRATCAGACPAYVVQIRGDGRVDYCGFDHVTTFGYQTRMLPEDSVRALIDQIKAAKIWNMAKAYVGKDVKDRQAVLVKVSFDNRIKSIVDHAGEQAGMPASLRRIEDEIDRVANTAEWVGQGGPAASAPPDCPSLGIVQPTEPPRP